MKIQLCAVVAAIAIPTLSVMAQNQPAAPAAAEPAPKAATEKSDTTASTPAHDPEEAVARVNGHDIKRKELDAAIHALQLRFARVGRRLEGDQLNQIERGLLDDMISRDLILQSAKTNQIADLGGKVQEQINEVKVQLGGDAAHAKALEEAGITEQEYKHRVLENIIVRETMTEVMKGAAPVTPEDVSDYYAKNPEQFVQPETVRASHILVRVSPDAADLVKAEKRAKMDLIRERLKGGESFASVARDVSEDTGSAPNGGDLGYFPRGSMVPEFETAALSLKTTELSDVITTQFGYHLLLVTDRRPQGQRPLDEVKTDTEDFLKAQRQAEAARKHVTDLRATAKVEVFWKPSAPAAPVETPAVQAPNP